MSEIYDIELLTADNLNEMTKFDRSIVYILDEDNPALVSFIRDEEISKLAVTGKKDYAYFIYRDPNTEQIIARCGINFHPPEDDIAGYGEKAADLYAKAKIASLVGDLVHPDYRGRGLQLNMIEYRLNRLADQAYDYAVAGIVEGNMVSLNNYVKFGFSPIGKKTIQWENQPNRIDEVVLLAYKQI